MPRRSHLPGLCLGALGVVFGDIGTSPIYAFKECLRGPHGAEPTPENVLGVLSLIFWALTLVVTVKYLIFIMRASNQGAGGIFALLALLPEREGVHAKRLTWMTALGVVGAALLYGDGIITPAVSVLSAVEGLELVAPSLKSFVVPVTCAILLLLFALQHRGTGTIGKLFGPVMLLWFVVIGALGVTHIAAEPRVLGALSPHHAVLFFVQHGLTGGLILGAVVLAVTGGEALYADMGHFGAKPIRMAWFFVAMPALVCAYFGQGALVLAHPQLANNPFFGMVGPGIQSLALVVLSAMATVIASQALISGVFSLTRQAVQLGLLPRVNIRHTAREAEGQVYVPVVNHGLAVACVALVIGFQQSGRLASAYGIAVSGTMAITSLVYFEVVRTRWGWPLSKALAVLLLFLSFDLAFLAANAVKILDGGYIPISVAAVFGGVMLIWKSGELVHARRLQRHTESLASFVHRAAGGLSMRVPGTAVFVTEQVGNVPRAMRCQVRAIPALQEQVVVVGVKTARAPSVSEEARAEVSGLGHGFFQVRLRFGFMETPNLPSVLARVLYKHGVKLPANSTTYYLERETFVPGHRARMAPWREKLFSRLALNARRADAYYGLPAAHVTEIGEELEL
ncbi:MAG: KUP/HAK/KT family potassium transporter [Myxococcales bacterium]